MCRRLRPPFVRGGGGGTVAQSAVTLRDIACVEKGRKNGGWLALTWKARAINTFHLQCLLRLVRAQRKERQKNPGGGDEVGRTVQASESSWLYFTLGGGAARQLPSRPLSAQRGEERRGAGGKKPKLLRVCAAR